jgi:phage terminase large subunit GpA-like protein
MLLAHGGGAALLIQPTVEMAKRFSRQRLESLIENTPCLRGRVKDARSRDSGNTVLLKQYTGGTLILTGANSAVGLRSLPAKYVLMDEIDGFPLDADGEGDPIALATKRTAAFGSQKRILCFSTPTIAGFSRIEALYQQSNQQRFFVPCSRCGFFQVLLWPNLRWDEGNPQTARYICESCGEAIRNHEKTGMLARGEWRATAAGDGRTSGFHINALYAPVGWLSWADLAREWIEAQKSEETLQVFVNTVLAQTWADQNSQPVDADVLYGRREAFAAEVPMGASLLTAGVDVQDDRLELEIVGWGRNEQSWRVQYSVLYGDPTQPEVWNELDRLLLRDLRHESGFELDVSAVCVDTGYHSAEAQEFCRPRLARKVWPVKGAPGFSKPIFPRRTGGSHGSKNLLFLAGVDSAKEKVYAKLRVETAGAGYCHFPLTRDQEYFTQLCAERITVKHTNGFPTRCWGKSPSARNEALDCRTYALVALHGLYQHGFSLEQHCSQFELMCAPSAERPAQSGYEIVRSKWMS